MKFQSTRAADQEHVRQLLREVFHASDNAEFLQRPHVEWKYYIDRADWPGSRSFVISDEERTLAHACAWPFSVLWNGETIRGFHPIDWAACPSVPGVGTLLLREMRRLSDISLSIGGTEAARKVITRIGYRPSGELRYYARPMRPWLQARTHQRRNWKLPARLARNWLWNARWPASAPQGWTVEPVEANEMPPELFPVSNAQVTACVRTVALFRYYEQCPIAPHQLYVIKQHGEAKGYFLLSLVPGQARVADAWVTSGNAHDWEALFRLAAAAALTKHDVAEITAASAVTAGQAALTECGFRVYETVPVMLFDPNKRLNRAPPVHFQMIDNDFSFLHQGRPDYVT